MENKSLNDIYKSVVKGYNFITPCIIDYFKIKNGVAELSKGKNIEGKDIYGVSVVVKDEDGLYKYHPQLSKPFNSIDSAMKYINLIEN